MNIEKEMVYVGCSRYDFVPEGENRGISACNAFLIDFSQIKNEADKSGMSVSQIKGDYSLFEQLSKLTPLKPYKFELSISIDGKKTVVTLVNVLKN